MTDIKTPASDPLPQGTGSSIPTVVALVDLGNGSEPQQVTQSNLELEMLVNQVRMFIRDYPELNRLVSGVANSNRQIVWAIFDAIDDFNSYPPVTRAYNIATFPSRSKLIRATVISLMESEGILQTRNQLSFSDGGIQVSINDKGPYYQRWIDSFRQDYTAWRERTKISNNIEGAWGIGVHSEYRWTTNWYGAW